MNDPRSGFPFKERRFTNRRQGKRGRFGKRPSLVGIMPRKPPSPPRSAANEMSEVMIECEGLTKRFGTFTAVDHVSFSIARGSIFGFLGPNGSGKSTVIRMLCGILEPTEGARRSPATTSRTKTMPSRK